ncbi:MAG: hypothetical protein JXR26_04095 [Balneolaceae bacterium]|nr:hypothetical protein [Balneolaceae bacterium]
MADREISQEQLDRLIEDASYLQDEAEALKYVIDEVPYDEDPPDGRSIVEMLLLIDHAQLSYYRPILESAVNDQRPTHIDNFEDFENSFEPDEEKMKDIQKLLSKLSKHRAGVINTIKNIPLIDWETVIYNNNQQLLLFDFIQQMIRFDRAQLKKIADLVMLYNNEKQNRRQIEQKRANQNHQSEDS